MNGLLDEIERSDAIVLASPMNFWTVTAVMKRFIERLVCFAYWPWGTAGPKMRNKPKTKRAVVVVSSACPSLLARLMTRMVGLMKSCAKLLGAKNGRRALHRSCRRRAEDRHRRPRPTRRPGGWGRNWLRNMPLRHDLAGSGRCGMIPDMWWHESDDGTRLICDLCPRHCALQAGRRGFCFVRENRDGRVVSTTYGRSTGFCIDPIEKKPLNQFYPGTPVLSFGTPGCNLGCKFCQNWTMSRSRDVEAACEQAAPEAIAAAAKQLGCRSVAFTYNDPIIWAEYAIDTAKACHAAGRQDRGRHVGLHHRRRPGRRSTNRWTPPTSI